MGNERTRIMGCVVVWAMLILLGVGTGYAADSRVTPHRLYELAAAGNRSALQELVKAGHEIDTLSGTVAKALQTAVDHDDTRAVLLLLDVGANPNRFDGADPPLHAAAWKGNLEIVNALLRHGADVGLLSESGESVLHYAVLGMGEDELELDIYFGQDRVHTDPSHMCDVLIDAGASVNAITPEGLSVLMTACDVDDVNAVRTLLKHGANVNYRNPRTGETELVFAVKHWADPEILRCLLERGADVHARDALGETAVYWAALDDEYPEAVRCLVSYGADLDAPTLRGETARQLLNEDRAARNPVALYPAVAEPLVAVRQNPAEVRRNLRLRDDELARRYESIWIPSLEEARRADRVFVAWWSRTAEPATADALKQSRDALSAARHVPGPEGLHRVYGGCVVAGKRLIVCHYTYSTDTMSDRHKMPGPRGRETPLTVPLGGERVFLDVQAQHISAAWKDLIPSGQTP